MIWSSVSLSLPVVFLIGIFIVSLLLMAQHLRHKNMKAILCLICSPGLYFLFNLKQLGLAEEESIHPYSVRLFLAVFVFLAILRVVIGISRLVFSLISFLIIGAFGYQLYRPDWDLLFLLFSIGLLVFKLKWGRNYLLHRRFFAYFSAMNIGSILAGLAKIELLSSTFDFLTCIFLLYFINLFLVEISFKSRMRETTY